MTVMSNEPTTNVRQQAMVSTKNDMPRESREKLVLLINARLADTLDLATQLKQAHWNVKGPSFHGLHELFDQATADVREYVDLIAERGVQLGGVVNGTARDAAAHSELPEYPHDAISGQQHADAASTALAECGKRVRAAIHEAEELGDADTADIFTEVSRGVDKHTWFVEAHTQADD